MKKMGRPPVDTEAVTVRLPRELIAGLDDARREDPEMPTRQEVIRRILVAWQAGRSAHDDAGAS
ncbi:hypothetical protein [Gemmobacter lutimaris]|jgi:Arc/MetJ-type ribon-helix-helix transcriptional regulator|nr:hypothetical protein [Gemmobacter lutimaris]